MKYLFYISLIAALIISCKPANERQCFKNSGNQTSIIHFNINANKLVMYDDIGLTLIQDSLNYLEIIGGENIIPFVEIKVKNGTISFENTNTCNFTRKQETLTVYYHCSNVDSVQLNGYGKLSNEGFYKSDIYIGSYESFSSIKMNLDNENTTISGQVGSIDAELTGKCTNLYMYSNGSGFMDASRITCKSSHGHSQGVGDFYLSATEYINVELRSRGNFYINDSSTASKQITNEGEGNVIYQ